MDLSTLRPVLMESRCLANSLISEDTSQTLLGRLSMNQIFQICFLGLLNFPEKNEFLAAILGDTCLRYSQADD